MLDALVDLVAPVWGLVVIVGAFVGVYSFASFFLFLSTFWELLKSRDLQFLRSTIVFALIFAPLPLAVVLYQHDKYATCERDLDRDQYLESRYSAEEMDGKLSRHNCVAYRQNRDLPWRSEDDDWNY